MANNIARHPYDVHIGLYKTTTEPAATEGDVWYNNAEGQTKVRLDGRTGIVGPHGSHPLIYGVANAWYPVTPGGASHLPVTTTNGRAYAYPLNPGRKCELAGLAIRVSTAGTGNARMMIYSADPTTGLPGPLLSDFGTASIATAPGATVSSFFLGTGLPLEPFRYWLVLAMQTSGAPAALSAYPSASPFIPFPITTPTFALTSLDFWNCVYSDTGFGAGSPPNPFGAVAGATFGPFTYANITQ